MSISPLCQYPDGCSHPQCGCGLVGQAITAGCSTPTVVLLMIIRCQLESDLKHRFLLPQLDAEIARLRRSS
jgi:hypothetical protein